MKIGIMQPYLFPYIGYFQLMNAVDEFVVYDNIEYTKKGWINRNRILVNGKDEYISFPLKKDSDFLHVNQRELAATWPEEKKKLLNKIKGCYQKAPYFKETYSIIEEIVSFEDNNLFNFIFHSLDVLKNALDIKTPLKVASTIPVDHTLKGKEKVLAICKGLNASAYINPIGGVDLYNKESFSAEGISLHFLKANGVVYQQFANEFIPFLSIIDVLMFNCKGTINKYLEHDYELV